MELSLTQTMDYEVNYIDPDYALASINLSLLPELLIITKDDIEQQNRSLKKRKNNPHKSAIITIIRDVSPSMRTFDVHKDRLRYDEQKMQKSHLKNFQLVNDQDSMQNRILPKESQLSTSFAQRGGSSNDQQLDVIENHELQIESLLRSKSKSSVKVISNVKNVSPANSKEELERDSFQEAGQQAFDLSSRSSNQMQHIKGILKQSRSSSSMNNSRVSFGSQASSQNSDKKVRFNDRKETNTLFRELMHVNKSKIE